VRQGGAKKQVWKDLFPELEKLEKDDRNIFSIRTSTTALYIGDEVEAITSAEKRAVLRAAPRKELETLNGIDIGCGGAPTHPSLVGIDLVRETAGSEAWRKEIGQVVPPNSLLSWADDLPFAPESLDYIVSRHNLEHVADPIGALLHYLDIVKPGGGIGIVVPDWHYAWDASVDNNFWGHKWNSDPETVCQVFHACLSDRSTLEHLRSYRKDGFALSFDFVLRKSGTYTPTIVADPDNVPAQKRMSSGAKAVQEGSFVGKIPHQQ
jgi:SAM-dependent methyltransferase